MAQVRYLSKCLPESHSLWLGGGIRGGLSWSLVLLNLAKYLHYTLIICLGCAEGFTGSNAVVTPDSVR